MLSARDTAVFVPAHNEAEALAGVLARIVEAGGGRIGALVVADDASTDQTVDVARRFTDHVVRLNTNGGNGMATRAALKHIAKIRNDWHAVVRIDGDGQHDPELLPEVLKALDDGAGIVVCSRFHNRSDTRHAMFDRHCLNRSAAQWVSDVTGWRVTDARSGFLGFKWGAISPVIDDLRTDRYGIPIELLLRTHRASPKARYVEIPHPAKYDKGLSNKLDRKYEVESVKDKVARLSDAYSVFLRTCEDLDINGEPASRHNGSICAKDNLCVAENQ